VIKGLIHHRGAKPLVTLRDKQMIIRAGNVPTFVQVTHQWGPIKIGVFIFTNAKETYPEPTYSGNWKILKVSGARLGVSERWQHSMAESR
jgi:hypothetical protein